MRDRPVLFADHGFGREKARHLEQCVDQLVCSIVDAMGRHHCKFPVYITCKKHFERNINPKLLVPKWHVRENILEGTGGPASGPIRPENGPPAPPVKLEKAFRIRGLLAPTRWVRQVVPERNTALES
ncbi:hypothetical protein [uncultured Alsobacter sp.]|uniref:hypothetical protein n=1 Tax=uncultured Alsobacter sp. TaxID=1748258 RepID=UPI0025F04866|nr:hypothetical protein [uncultured Alsobacter sp.]